MHQYIPKEYLPYFRSINCILNINNATEQKIASLLLKDFSTWLTNYDSWYNNQLQINNNNLFFVYNRNISLLGNGLVKILDSIEKFIHPLSLKLGFSLSISLEVCECLDYYDEILLLKDKGILRHIFLRFDNNNKTSPKEICSLVEKLISNGVAIDWIGPVSPLLSSDLLDSEVLNSNHITIYPQNKEVSEAEVHITPCAGMFSIFIDMNGYIYPCFPLVGCNNAHIGTIYDDIETTLFRGEIKVCDIMDWLENGPKVDMSSNNFANKKFRKQCHIHRHTVFG